MPKMKPRPDVNAPHPLEASVIEIFRKRSPQDRTTLAAGLSGPDPRAATFVKSGPDSPRLGISPNRAYLMVAEDVLRWMHSQGRLAVDESGWYRLAGPLALDTPRGEG